MHPSFATDAQNGNPASQGVNENSANLLGSGGSGLQSLSSLGTDSTSSLGGLPLSNFLGGADLSALSGTSAFGGLGNSGSLSSSGGFGAENNSSISPSSWTNSWSPAQNDRSSYSNLDNHPSSSERSSYSNDTNRSIREQRDQSASAHSTQDTQDTARARAHEREQNNTSRDGATESSSSSANAHEHLQRRESSRNSPESSATSTHNSPLGDASSSSNAASTSTQSGTTPTDTVNAHLDSTNPSEDAHSDKLTLANQALNQQRLPSIPLPAASPTTPSSSSAKSATAADTDPSASGAQNLDPNALSAQPTPELKTMALGDNSQIVTTSRDAPSEKSLADFARSMGFDESAISELFGPDANALMLNAAALQAAHMNPVALNPGNGLPSALTTGNASAGLTLTTNAESLATLTLNNNASANSLASPTAAFLTSNTLGTAANPLSHLPSNGLGANTALNTLTLSGGALGAPALNPGLQGGNGASLLSANVTMGTLTGTDAVSANANVSDLNEMLAQAGVNTSAAKLNFSASALSPGRLGNAMAGNATAPASTLSVLNMTGSTLSSSAIESLQTAFNQLSGKGAFSTAETKAFDVALGANSLVPGTDASQAVVATLDLSGQSSQNGSGNNANPSALMGDASVSQNPLNMADTYEKLSNQLASELSRRMNDQISQGQWKMKFALKPSSLGAVDVSLEMKDGKLAAVLQSDNALTQNLLQHGSQQLKDNLSVLGLNQTSVQIGQGSSGGASANGQGPGHGAQNPFDDSKNANSINDLTQASPTVADATITGNSNDSLLDTFA